MTQQLAENGNRTGPSPFLVLVAGMPRSGSTWVFNAARLILEKHCSRVHAVWCADYDVADGATAHLVKVHKPEEARCFVPDRVLTSHRDIAECIVSLIRMGWVKNHVDNITAAAKNQESLYGYWHARSHLEVEYQKLLSEPEKEVGRIGDVLGLPVGMAEAERMAEELSRLTPPINGRYDSVTLLHPQHRGDKVSARLSTEYVRRILDKHKVS